MTARDDEAAVDPYELVERWWPYDGPYSDEHTTTAATMIQRLGRYLNNATQTPAGLSHAAAAGQVLAELTAAIAGFDQLLGQLARFLDHEADTNPSLYDDRRERPGADTARRTARELREAIRAVRDLATLLAAAAGLASHLGSA